MNHHRKTWVICAAGWAVLGLALAQDRAARAADDSKENRGTLMAIGHALEMGIDGSNMNFAARETDASKGTLTRVAESVGSGRTKEQWTSLKQLREDAGKAFADSRQMLRTASKDLANADARSRERQLFDATNQYIGTLESMTGERPEQANNPEQAAKTGSRAGGPWKLSAEDVAAVSVINNAVHNFHTGFKLRKALEKSESGGATIELLRQHAKTMEDSGMQCVQRYINAQATPNANATAPNAAANRNEKPIDRPIRMLAEHAQTVIHAIQQWEK